MKFVVANEVVELDTEKVRACAARAMPEVIQTHWVDLDGVIWPPKQLLELATGLPRARFLSHSAIRIFQQLGLPTSEIPNSIRPPTSPAWSRSSSIPGSTAEVSLEALHRSVDVLADFMRGNDLTGRISALEQQLLNSTNITAIDLVSAAGIDTDTLAAALTVRRTLGRVSDVVHAAVICLALPSILKPGEVVSNRPSLAAGNDPTRPFDLETTQRVAEFKVSVWKGADAMRKRGVFADLVHLALDESGRTAQLFVVGDEPRRFLEESRSSAAWGRTRGSNILRQRYLDRFGSLDEPICTVRATHAVHVDIVDLNNVIPGLANLLAAA